MICLKQTGETFSDVQKARDAVLRLAAANGTNESVCADLVFDPETYTIDKTVRFSVAENPELAHLSVSFSCERGNAVITSQNALDASRFVKKGVYYTYQFEKDVYGNYPRFHDFYVNGARIPVATSPFFTHAFAFSKDPSEDMDGIYIPEESAALLPEGDLSSLEFAIYIEWEFFVLHALRLDKSKTKTDDAGKTHVLLKIAPNELSAYVNGVTKCIGPKNREFFFGNHASVLKENTWCYDHKTGVLCYYPKDDLLGDCSIATLGSLFYLNGMNGVSFKNITFTGATDQFICDNGFLGHQANIEKRGHIKIEEGAIVARDTRRFTVEQCTFRELGVNGILMLGRSALVNIRNSVFDGISMCGVSIGDPTTPSAKNPDGCFSVNVDNNYLSRIAYEFPNAPAIDIFRADGLSICHNTIEYCAYTGISIGWGWGQLDTALGEMTNIRDAEIAYNRILYFMQSLKDGGAIYAVGANCTKEYTPYFNFMHDNYAFRTNVERTVRGYYLDGSSTNWHVYNSVASGMFRPAFAQWHVPTEYTWNCRMDHIYVTEKVDAGNHAPDRNTLFSDIYLEPTVEDLFEKYPVTKEIYENSGYKPVSENN